MNTDYVVIVSNHAATIEWLKENGVTGLVYSHITDPEVLKGKIVYGNLPLHLAAFADKIYAIGFANLPKEKRHMELTLDDMYAYKAFVKPYRVTALED